MTIFDNINDQTICEVCGSKMSGQFVIGDATIYLFCETCEDNGKKNGWHHKMLGTVDEYMQRLAYLQIVDPKTTEQ